MSLETQRTEAHREAETHANDLGRMFAFPLSHTQRMDLQEAVKGLLIIKWEQGFEAGFKEGRK